MYSIKDMPKLERPRERLLLYGPKSLSTYELLAILLRTGYMSLSAIDLAKRIMQETENLGELRSRTISEFTSIKGIGETKAITILAAIELGERVLHPNIEKIQITSPNDVYELLKYDVMDLKQEVLIALFLDLKTNLITKKQIFKGSLNQSLVHPREVYKYAVKYSAFQIILVHNHPSGDPTPSEQDIEVTKRFTEVGNLLQIKLLDHVIIGSNNYISVLEYTK